MEAVGSGIFEFERFRLDRRGGGLFCADTQGAFVPVAIGSRALDVLSVLVQRHGDLVSKDEIMTAVWPGIAVADSNLPIQILALRRVLDHDRGGGSCIQTVAGRGYRFVAPVTEAQCKYADTTEAVEAPTASVGRDPLVERRPLTVLAASIVGFPPSATELDPEELLDTMAALYRAWRSCSPRFRRSRRTLRFSPICCPSGDRPAIRLSISRLSGKGEDFRGMATPNRGLVPPAARADRIRGSAMGRSDLP